MGQENNALTYLALGDSYTIGESVATNDRWPVQLVNLAAKSGVDLAQPVIIAKTGWTTDELQKAIEEKSLTKKFDHVSLLIGVNNQYRGYEFSQYEKEFTELLSTAVAFCKEKSNVFVVSIPDYGVTPFGQGKEPTKIARELDKYNDFARRACEGQGVTYFNITEISRKARNDKSLTAEDTLHPSGKMYTQWVNLIAPWLIAKYK